MNTRQKVLEDALKCVNGEREKQYGNPEDNFKRIADLWSVYLTSIFKDVVFELAPIDVAKMMILFKIARSNGDKDKMDNYVDMIGYAACAAEIFEGQERNEIEVFPCDHIKVTEECRVCNYREKCMGSGVCLKEKESEETYQYFMKKNFGTEVDKKNKECSTCYVCSDSSFDDAYKHISDYIASSSIRANANILDVVDHLTRTPTEMAALLVTGELDFDDVASYVDDAINEVKKETKNGSSD